jgi:hypothetical protein
MAATTIHCPELNLRFLLSIEIGERGREGGREGVGIQEKNVIAIEV